MALLCRNLGIEWNLGRICFSVVLKGINNSFLVNTGRWKKRKLKVDSLKYKVKQKKVEKIFSQP